MERSVQVEGVVEAVSAAGEDLLRLVQRLQLVREGLRRAEGRVRRSDYRGGLGGEVAAFQWAFLEPVQVGRLDHHWENEQQPTHREAALGTEDNLPAAGTPRLLQIDNHWEPETQPDSPTTPQIEWEVEGHRGQLPRPRAPVQVRVRGTVRQVQDTGCREPHLAGRAVEGEEGEQAKELEREWAGEELTVPDKDHNVEVKVAVLDVEAILAGVVRPVQREVQQPVEWEQEDQEPEYEGLVWAGVVIV